ncbi:MAG: hypothetical protein NZV14_09800 [Bryobacteraceae bacterium]|nr:hypothetical protein [Bryobacteraceae bacterium]MDW8378444.1 hypothetical protein [Bryobacterales bacterium]
MPFEEEVRQLELTAREQLQAAWRIHVARVEEQLQRGWPEHIEQIVSERFTGLASLLQQSAARTRREITEHFNQTARRLRLAEQPSEWRAILQESAAPFCARVGVFEISDPEIAQAPAVATLVHTRETTVALRTRGELGPRITAQFGESPSATSFLFPIFSNGTIQAILYAEQGDSGLDRNALELLATLASDTLPAPPSPLPREPSLSSGLIQLQPLSASSHGLASLASSSGTPSSPTATTASVSSTQMPLAGPDEELDLRARRFARVRIAEMRLYDSAAVRHGREIRNLYGVLRSKIDSARQEFQQEFLQRSPFIADYFHQELVRTLANNDEQLLGADYPGPLR